MVRLRRLLCLFVGMTAFAAALSLAQPRCVSAQNHRAESKSLFTQSAIQVIGREFDSPDLSYLLLDARSGETLAARWESVEKPIPLGSLVKPFTTIAYGEEHHFQFPEHICRGEASGCWQRAPHGKMNIVSAISHSCNSYFRVLAANVSNEQIASTAGRFGIELPPADVEGPVFMGLGTEWRISPLRMAHAYLELVRRSDQPGVREVLAGMAKSSREGTGFGVGHALKHADALVKTGTAPCTHEHPAPGDGFVIALVPAQQPELLLMIRVHSAPGAKASLTAGRMLARLEE